MAAEKHSTKQNKTISSHTINIILFNAKITSLRINAADVWVNVEHFKRGIGKYKKRRAILNWLRNEFYITIYWIPISKILDREVLIELDLES